MGHLDGLGDCPLAYGDNSAKRCAWCGSPLPRGRRRWCSDDHALAWASNHSWSTVRSFALARDGYICQRCGRGWGCRILLDVLLRLSGHASSWQTAPWRDREAWIAWTAVVLEVNHRTPVLGRHSETGCHHHLDLVEALCHRCHLDETRAQRRAGLLRRAPAPGVTFA